MPIAGSRSHSRVSRLSGLFLLLLSLLPFATLQAAENIKLDFLSLNRSVAYLDEEIIVTFTVLVPEPLRGDPLSARFALGEIPLGEITLPGDPLSERRQAEFSFAATKQGRFDLAISISAANSAEGPVTASRQLAILSLPGDVIQAEPAAEDAPPSAAPGGEALPDFVPTAIAFDHPSPLVGQAVTISATIGNRGAQAAKNAAIRLFVNGQPYGDDFRVDLEAGAEADIAMTYTPTRQGTQDILVMVNPDEELAELSKRNNILSKTLIVRPVAEGPAEGKRAEALPGPTTASRANLVSYVETINQVHYSPDGKLRVFVVNISKQADSPATRLHILPADDTGAAAPLFTGEVPALAAGEAIEITLDWPDERIDGDRVFIALADGDETVAESSENDNLSPPFRVIIVTTPQPGTALQETETRAETAGEVTEAGLEATDPPMPEQPASTPLPPAEFIVTQPLEGTQLALDGQMRIGWKSAGNPGDQVRITVLAADDRRRIVTATTDNDGQYTFNLAALPSGTYLLQLASLNGTTSARETRFHVNRAEPAMPSSLITPLADTTWFGQQQMLIRWPALSADVDYISLQLVEVGTQARTRVTANPIAAAFGEYRWRIPDDATLFGRYRLELSSLDGRVIAAVEPVEILPSFVIIDDQPAYTGQERQVQADISIDGMAFAGPHLEFSISNRGPQELGPSVTPGLVFHTYFVRRVPLQTSDDLAICQGTLWGALLPADNRTISLGRDPNCRFGLRSSDQRFAYAVTLFTPPGLIDVRFVDPEPGNNFYKFYWPAGL